LFDVIVAGAGPAGNIAASRLSTMGYKVVVLDWRSRVGDKLCTGIVGRECVELYPPDQGDIHHEAQSATVVAPSGTRHRIARESTQAYVLDREAYIASLADRARGAGAHYRLGETVEAIQHSPSGVALRASSSAGSRQYRARVVVIASGFSSPLLRMVGLDGGQAEYMIGSQAEVTATGLEGTEVYLGDSIAPGSFGWLVPLSGSRALAGIVSRRKLNGHMSSFISALRQEGKVQSVTSEPRRWGIPIRPLRRTFADGVLVAGDAAGFVKPTTGGGIYYALLSGEVAADTVHAAFLADDFSAGELKRYEAGWKSIFGKELRIGYYARRVFEALGDRNVERLFDELISAGIMEEFLVSDDLSFDWHSSVILKAIANREFSKIIRSFGPAVAPFLPALGRSRSD